MKKLFIILFALVLAIALSVPVFAAGETAQGAGPVTEFFAGNEFPIVAAAFGAAVIGMIKKIS